MNIQALFYWVMIVIVIAVVAILVAMVLALLLSKKLSKVSEKARQDACDYLNSELHARTIASRIAFERTAWTKAEKGAAWLKGGTPLLAEHLFLNTLIFEEEGLKASVVTKNARGGVALVFLPGRVEFATKVVNILSSEFGVAVAVRCEEKLKGHDEILGDQRS